MEISCSDGVCYRKWRRYKEQDRMSGKALVHLKFAADYADPREDCNEAA